VHEHLGGVDGAGALTLAPQLVHEAIGGHDLPGVERKDSEYRPLANASQGNRVVVADPHLKRPEDPQLQRGPHGLNGNSGISAAQCSVSDW
jgi:hypothetical protein